VKQKKDQKPDGGGVLSGAGLTSSSDAVLDCCVFHMERHMGGGGESAVQKRKITSYSPKASRRRGRSQMTRRQTKVMNLRTLWGRRERTVWPLTGPKKEPIRERGQNALYSRVTESTFNEKEKKNRVTVRRKKTQTGKEEFCSKCGEPVLSDNQDCPI